MAGKQQSMFTRVSVIGVILLLLAGCANFAQEQRTRQLQATIGQAMKDDETCREEGREYPSVAYTRCRQSLQDKREQRRLFGLQLIEGEQEPMDLNDPRTRPSSQRGDFRCEQRQWGDTEWIDCRTYQEER